MYESPLFKEGKVKSIDVFNSSKICQAYEKMGLNVTRFFEGIEKVFLLECSGSGYRFYYPYSTIGDAEFYKNLSLNRKNYYSIRWEHQHVLPTIKTNAKILEIGSGFGAFLNLAREKSIKAEGLELNPEAILNCKNQGLTIHNVLIEDFVKTHKEIYDVVCYFQVLEHVTNVHGFIKGSLEALKPGGKLIIGVPNNNPYLFVKDKYHTLNLPPHHAGLWNKKALKSLETIFQIELESLTYEPLEKTYDQFLKVYIDNSNWIYSRFLISMHKVAPKVVKRMICKSINGRNILAVFKKRA